MAGRRSTVRRGITAMLAATMIALVVATPASAAFSSNVTAYPITSKCVGRSSAGNPLISWRGGETQYSDFAWYPFDEAPHGTMYFCYTTYRLGNKTSDGDYYGVDLKSVWSGGGLMNWMQAVARQSVSSTVTPKDSVYDWTGTYTSSHECSVPISVGIGAGPISIGTTIQACSGYKVTLESHASISATWRSDYALKVPSMENSYFEKVPHGSVPKFTFTWKVPYYSYTTDSNGHWVVTAKWDTYSYTVTGTA